MRCDDAQASLSAAFDDEPSDLDATNAHLVGCVTCQAFRRTLVESRERFRSTDGPEPDVVDAVLTRVGGGRRNPASPTRSRHSGGRLLVAAVAVVGLGVAGIAVRESMRDGEGPQVATPIDEPGPLDPVQPVGEPAPTPTAPGLDPGGAGRPVNAVIWSPGRVDHDVVPTLELRGELARTVVRRGTVGLVASASAEGEPIDRVEAGWTIPLEVIAVDPIAYGKLLGGPEIASLDDSGVVLGATSSRLRGVGVGGTLTLEGQELTVDAVVSDEAAGAAEAVVTRQTGGQLGLVADRYVIVETAEPASLAAAVEEVSTAPVRLRVADETPFLRSSDAVTPQVFLKERFGEFALRADGDSYEIDDAWFADNITTVAAPLLGDVTCHRGILDELAAAQDEIDELGLAGALDAFRFQGCWNPRPISGSDDLSRHTWGVAFDLGWAADVTPDEQVEVARVMARHGFTWGAPWLTPDPIHFEYHDHPEAP